MTTFSHHFKTGQVNIYTTPSTRLQIKREALRLFNSENCGIRQNGDIFHDVLRVTTAFS
jgi:hypothetical protein